MSQLTDEFLSVKMRHKNNKFNSSPVADELPLGPRSGVQHQNAFIALYALGDAKGITTEFTHGVEALVAPTVFTHSSERVKKVVACKMT